MSIIRLSEKIIGQNQYATAYLDQVRLPNGKENSHFRFDVKTGAVIIVKSIYGNYYLHKAYHYSAGKEFFELIRGHGEGDIKENIKRVVLKELDEEIGCDFTIVDGPVYVGQIYCNSTYYSKPDPIWQVIVEPGAKRKVKEDGEGIHSGDWYSLWQIAQLIRDGTIDDGFTVSAFSFILAREYERL